MDKQQKAMHARYHEELKKAWKDPKMVDFCTKHAQRVFVLADGELYEIAKPAIEKDFCFGYHCSAYNNDSYNEAADAARAAESDVEHFMRENLKHFREWIEALHESLDDNDRYQLYSRPHYTSQTEDCKLRNIEFYDPWFRATPPKGGRKLSKDEIAIIIDEYQLALQEHIKRLETYLKRYGLTQVRTWTYWLDE